MDSRMSALQATMARCTWPNVTGQGCNSSARLAICPSRAPRAPRTRYRGKPSKRRPAMMNAEDPQISPKRRLATTHGGKKLSSVRSSGAKAGPVFGHTMRRVGAQFRDCQAQLYLASSRRLPATGTDSYNR